jgi:hypothetical protein
LINENAIGRTEEEEQHDPDQTAEKIKQGGGNSLEFMEIEMSHKM